MKIGPNKSYRVISSNEKGITIRISFLNKKTFQFVNQGTRPVVSDWVELTPNEENNSYYIREVELVCEPHWYQSRFAKFISKLVELYSNDSTLLSDYQRYESPIATVEYEVDFNDLKDGGNTEYETMTESWIIIMSDTE